MSRGGYKITRCGDQHEAPGRSTDSNVPSWMKEFAANADKIVEANKEKSAVTVVDHARERNQSIYEQIYTIMNGKKPLYSSVEEAVLDYQNKTGLTNHLNGIQAEKSGLTLEAAAQKIIANSSDLVEKKTIKSELPSLFAKKPLLKNFLDGVIGDNPTISIPAVLHILAERFGVDESDLDDDKLSRYINQLLISNTPAVSNESDMMGYDLVSDSTEDNNDAFEVLRPSSSHY